MRILFLGDVVGNTGCSKVKNNLLEQKKIHKIDFVIINAENADNSGVGLTKEICHDFFDCGVDVITTGNHVWDQKETMEHIDKAMELELAYARDVLPNGILGLNSDMFIDYVQYIANRRLEALELPSPYEDVKNPFPWMSEIIDLEKCKNFFETRVTEYSVGNLVDDF